MIYVYVNVAYYDSKLGPTTLVKNEDISSS